MWSVKWQKRHSFLKAQGGAPNMASHLSYKTKKSFQCISEHVWWDYFIFNAVFRRKLLWSDAAAPCRLRTQIYTTSLCIHPHVPPRLLLHLFTSTRLRLSSNKLLLGDWCTPVLPWRHLSARSCGAGSWIHQWWTAWLWKGVFLVVAHAQASLKHQTHVTRWRDDGPRSREEIGVGERRGRLGWFETIDC